MKKYTVKYSGYREILAISFREAEQHAFDCPLSVNQSIEVESIYEENPGTEYCEDCECELNECQCAKGVAR